MEKYLVEEINPLNGFEYLGGLVSAVAHAGCDAQGIPWFTHKKEELDQETP